MIFLGKRNLISYILIFAGMLYIALVFITELLGKNWKMDQELRVQLLFWKTQTHSPRPTVDG